jgi:hypothetical protein
MAAGFDCVGPVKILPLPLPIVKYPLVLTNKLLYELPLVEKIVGNDIGVDEYPSSKLVKIPLYKV